MIDKKNLMSEADFEALLDEFNSTPKEGYVAKATVINEDKNMVTVDLGLKTEAYIPRREFGADAVKKGDIVDVYVERYEGPDGNVIASRDKARREEAWVNLEKKIAGEETIEGVVMERVRGGFIVDLYGVLAFMPGSQADLRPLHNPDDLIGKTQNYKILKMDHARSNVIVSHRAIMEDQQADQRREMMQNIKIGDALTGTVKNITDYGVFVDLGGIDGLLHVTDLSWKRISHPKELLAVGDEVKVKVIAYDAETQRISLGMKQLEEDPWKDLINTFNVGDQLTGKVSNITDYGVFVELSNGVEGLVHVSEMSWTKKNTHPSKIVELGQEVKVQVLEIDSEKRRLSLGIKQTQENPWAQFAASHEVGQEVEGEIKNITEFGLFVTVATDLDGMVHIGDLDWDVAGEEAIKEYKAGDKIKAKILEISVEKERISLGVKQLKEDRVGEAIDEIKKGDIITCTIKEVEENGLVVDAKGLNGYIARMDLARERSEQRTDRFAADEKIDAIVLSVSKKDRKVKLSVKALEINEEKKMMKEYGSTESGAALADILGAAIAEKKEDK